MSDVAGAHIQLFASRADAPLRWRLLSGNNREIGRSVPQFPDLESCRLAVKQLQNAIDDLEATVRRTTSSSWAWRLARGGEPVAASGRQFDRMIRCKQGLAAFLQVIADAEIGSVFMVSQARRWESRSDPLAALPRVVGRAR